MKGKVFSVRIATLCYIVEMMIMLHVHVRLREVCNELLYVYTGCNNQIIYAIVEKHTTHYHIVLSGHI